MARTYLWAETASARHKTSNQGPAVSLIKYDSMTKLLLNRYFRIFLLHDIIKIILIYCHAYFEPLTNSYFSVAQISNQATDPKGCSPNS